ncbi:hypothetical protein CLV49_0089 [Labedella gwakjiensis]|uniref:GyrI-like small molecule binding domain-containing protein n=1 Tax=Labedella gwakjiensis TaxID=390269 RepID=A0A2P8GRA3_9MICO|nr:GyrI-like domain-containing protein [Labedella gwakjiensis]PSL36498.1 hypothetical protein CLV49_0089 [Labedella gwakjiensis]RUQ85581.1 hypothetical protein ELQ93_00620 [Labedella gwakjiensis]
MAIDRKRTLDAYRARSGEFRLLDVPPMTYLRVEGAGDPNTSESYAAALAALYPVAYALKFGVRSATGEDHVVMPLEALWWADDMASFTTARDKARWNWAAMILVPDTVSPTMFAEAVASVARKKAPARIGDVRLACLDEGQCVQTLHVGSYDDEAPTLAALHDRFLPEHGLRPTGRHHEIYLSDPRRVEPARLRTILRQPVAPA